MGTLTTPTRRPCRLRHAQRDSPSRNDAFVKRKPPPPRSGSIKSNNPCLPGFLPVIKLDQAQGVIGGIVDSSELRAPLLCAFIIAWLSSHQHCRHRPRGDLLPSTSFLQQPHVGATQLRGDPPPI